MTRAAVGYIHGLGQILAGSVLTNSAPGDVLNDTGPLDQGNYLFAVQGYVDVSITNEFQIRDSANAVTKTFVRRKPAAGDVDMFIGNKVTLLQGGRGWWRSPARALATRWRWPST